MKPRHCHNPAHEASGRDFRGEQLDIRIRIDARGHVYFHDIPEAMLGVARSLDPRNEDMMERERIQRQFDMSSAGTAPGTDAARADCEATNCGTLNYGDEGR